MSGKERDRLYHYAVGVGGSGENYETRNCGYTIEGPKMGRNVVLWRKQCGHQIRVATTDHTSRCWQHTSGPRR